MIQYKKEPLCCNTMALTEHFQNQSKTFRFTTYTNNRKKILAHKFSSGHYLWRNYGRDLHR